MEGTGSFRITEADGFSAKLAPNAWAGPSDARPAGSSSAASPVVCWVAYAEDGLPRRSEGLWVFEKAHGPASAEGGAFRYLEPGQTLRDYERETEARSGRGAR